MSVKATKLPHGYKACIFDLDGTLLDSMGVWEHVDEIFLGKRGLPLSEEYLNAISVMKLNIAADYTIKLFNLKEAPEDIIKEWLDLARHEFTFNVQPKPYGVKYIKMLKEKNIPIAVATSGHKELYVPVLKRIGIFDLFDVIYDSDKINCGKDSPEIFIKCAADLKTEPKDCLVFEDTVKGIASAKKAGFITVGFLDNNRHSNTEKLMSEADYSATDFKEFYEALTAKAVT